MARRKANVVVQVTTSIERALKKLKKTSEREGVVRDIKRIVYFEKKTQKARKRLVRAIKQEVMRKISQKLYK